MGYGSRALELLEKYYSGEIVSVAENAPSGKIAGLQQIRSADLDGSAGLQKEVVGESYLSSLPYYT